jgi:hypothetical protein
MVLLEGRSSDGYGPIVVDNPLGSHFGGQPYVLRSYTQTLGAYGHQRSVLLAHRPGVTDDLDLFTKSGIPSAASWYRVPPSETQFVEHPVDIVAWTIVQLCEIVAITEPGTTDSVRVFASVRARRCWGSCDQVHAGVVELELVNLSSTTRSWRVALDEYGLGRAAMRGRDRYAFSNECMPIDVTTAYGDQTAHRLVVVDPSDDSILLYDVANLRSGPIDTIHTPDSSRSPVDVAIVGDREGSANYLFVTSLWRGSGSPQLRHHNGSLNDLSGTAHLTESMPSDVRFIQGPLQGVTTTPAFRADLYTLTNNQVVRRTYEY